MNGCVLLFCKPDRTSGSFVGIFRNDVLNMGKFSCFFLTHRDVHTKLQL